MTALQSKCKRGHRDWIIDNSGERRCKTCRDMNRKKHARPELGKGPEDATFCRSEIMRARGYGE